MAAPALRIPSLRIIAPARTLFPDAEVDPTIDLSVAPRLDARARVFLDAMHDRHVPLTPRLAIALARMEEESPAAVLPWGHAYSLAAAALGINRGFGNTAAWHRVHDVFHIHVAEPVVRHAALALGEVVIFGPVAFNREDARFGSGPELEAYHQAIEEKVLAALTDPAVMGAAFWTSRGVILWGTVKRRGIAALQARGRGNAPAIPVDVDPVLTQLVFDCEPQFDDSGANRRRPPPHSTVAHHERAGSRPRQGGVEGILHSRKLEDLTDALYSEFMMPRDYRLLKFVEQGFLIKHRPPPQRPMRDLVSIAIDEAPLDASAATLAKAAWIDATTRLQLILADHRLTRSEFAWCGRIGNGLLAAAVSASGQRAKFELDPILLSGDDRRRMIADSSLTPAIFDRLPKINLRTKADEPAEIGRSDLLGQATDAAITACGEAIADVATSGQGKRPLRGSPVARPVQLSDYARAFALNIRPSRIGIDETLMVKWSGEQVAFAAAMGLQRARRHTCALILVPDRVEAGSVFNVFAGRTSSGGVIRIEADDDPRRALETVIGRLSDWIMVQTLEAIRG